MNICYCHCPWCGSVSESYHLSFFFFDSDDQPKQIPPTPLGNSTMMMIFVSQHECCHIPCSMRWQSEIATEWHSQPWMQPNYPLPPVPTWSVTEPLPLETPEAEVQYPPLNFEERTWIWPHADLYRNSRYVTHRPIPYGKKTLKMWPIAFRWRIRVFYVKVDQTNEVDLIQTMKHSPVWSAEEGMLSDTHTHSITRKSQCESRSPLPLPRRQRLMGDGYDGLHIGDVYQQQPAGVQHFWNV